VGHLLLTEFPRQVKRICVEFFPEGVARTVSDEIAPALSRKEFD
jgi:hypothetical protein